MCHGMGDLQWCELFLLDYTMNSFKICFFNLQPLCQGLFIGYSQFFQIFVDPEKCCTL